MIAEAAYYKAARRGFIPGYEAEREIEHFDPRRERLIESDTTSKGIAVAD